MLVFFAPLPPKKHLNRSHPRKVNRVPSALDFCVPCKQALAVPDPAPPRPKRIQAQLQVRSQKKKVAVKEVGVANLANRPIARISTLFYRLVKCPGPVVTTGSRGPLFGIRVSVAAGVGPGGGGALGSTRHPTPLELPRLPTWDPQKRGTAVPGWMFFGAILLIHSPKWGTAVPVTLAAGVGLGGVGAGWRAWVELESIFHWRVQLLAVLSSCTCVQVLHSNLGHWQMHCLGAARLLCAGAFFALCAPARVTASKPYPFMFAWYSILQAQTSETGPVPPLPSFSAKDARLCSF